MLGKWIIKMIWQMERSMAESYTPSGTREVNANAWARCVRQGIPLRARAMLMLRMGALRATRYTPSGMRDVNATHGRATRVKV